MKLSIRTFKNTKYVLFFRYNRAIWLTILFVFLVTFGIRLLFIFESSAIPAVRTPTPGMDIDLYWQSARLLLNGANTDEPCFELMMCSVPLYQYWLAFWQLILGPDQFYHRILNAFLCSISSVFIFFLTRRLTKTTWIAVVCGLFWATLPSIVFFDATLYKAGLALLLLVILVTLALSNYLNAFLKGVYAALLLTALYFLQHATIFYVVAISVFFLFDHRFTPKRRSVLLSAMIGLFLLLFIPYQLRDKIVEMKYPWAWPQKGVHFCIGFNDKADGTYVKLKNISSWPYGHLFQSKMAAEVNVGHPLTPAKSDQFYIKQGETFIFNHPLAALRIITKKVMLFFNNYEVKGVDHLYYLKERSHVMALLPFGIGLPLILFGPGVLYLIETRKYRILFLLAGILLSLLLSNIIIFISWRYRLQNVVSLILIAAFGLVAIQHNIRNFRYGADPVKLKIIRFSAMVIIPMLLCGWGAYYPVIGKKDERFYRSAVTNNRLSENAEKMEAALELMERDNPAQPGALIKKAKLLRKLHRHSEAYCLCRNLFEHQHYHPEVVYEYIRYLLWLGEYHRVSEIVNEVRKHNKWLIPTIERRLNGIEKKAYYTFVKQLSGETAR